MTTSKYQSKIQALSKKPIFTSAQARAVGIPARMLAHFSKTGTIERISRGIYRVTGSKSDIGFEWEDLAIIAMSIPDGVICLISALCYYELTDQIMREFWIAVPHLKSISESFLDAGERVRSGAFLLRPCGQSSIPH